MIRPWIRHWSRHLSDPDVLALSPAERCVYYDIGLLARQADDEQPGALLRDDDHPYSVDDIARALRVPRPVVVSFVKKALARGLLARVTPPAQAGRSPVAAGAEPGHSPVTGEAHYVLTRFADEQRAGKPSDTPEARRARKRVSRGSKCAESLEPVTTVTPLSRPRHALVTPTVTPDVTPIEEKRDEEKRGDNGHALLGNEKKGKDGDQPVLPPTYNLTDEEYEQACETLGSAATWGVVPELHRACVTSLARTPIGVGTPADPGPWVAQLVRTHGLDEDAQRKVAVYYAGRAEGEWRTHGAPVPPGKGWAQLVLNAISFQADKARGGDARPSAKDPAPPPAYVEPADERMTPADHEANKRRIAAAAGAFGRGGQA